MGNNIIIKNDWCRGELKHNILIRVGDSFNDLNIHNISKLSHKSEKTIKINMCDHIKTSTSKTRQDKYGIYRLKEGIYVKINSFDRHLGRYKYKKITTNMMGDKKPFYGNLIFKTKPISKSHFFSGFVLSYKSGNVEEIVAHKRLSKYIVFINNNNNNIRVFTWATFFWFYKKHKDRFSHITNIISKNMTKFQ